MVFRLLLIFLRFSVVVCVFLVSSIVFSVLWHSAVDKADVLVLFLSAL